jgi:hypothetical protein
MFSLRLLLVMILIPLASSCQTLDDIKYAREDIRAVKSYIVGGRDENPCVLGVPQTVDCYYVVKITDTNYRNNLIEGEISKLACDQNRDSGNDRENCDPNTGLHFVKRYFPIKGSPKNLKQQKDYEFRSQVDPNAPTAELVCLKGDGTPDPTGMDCAIRDKPLQTVP